MSTATRNRRAYRTRLKNPRHHRGCRFRRLRLEPMEDRRMLATVTWDGLSDGDGDGVSWEDPLNWEGDALPTSSDAAVIDVAGTPTINLGSGSHLILSLQTEEEVVISGGSLTINTSSVLNNSLIINGGSLNIFGGTVSGTGSIANDAGIMSVRGAIFGVSLTNSGESVFQGATSLNGGVNNTGSGVLRVLGQSGTGHANLTLAAGMTNAGNLVLLNASGYSSTVTVSSGELTNTGTIQSDSGTGGRTIIGDLDNLGTIDVDYNMTINVDGPTLNTQTGTVDAANPAVLTILGGTTNVGTDTTVLGDGQIDWSSNATVRALSDFTAPATGSALSFSGSVLIDGVGLKFINQQPAMVMGSETVNADLWNEGQITFQGATSLNGGVHNTGSGVLRVLGQSGTGHANLTLAGGMTNNGNLVLLNTSGWNSTHGIYAFVDLRAGSYTISETQPSGFLDGKDTLGTVDGLPSGFEPVEDGDQFADVELGPASVAVNYNFGERPESGGGVSPGQTATIGFWQNNNGQELIRSLNGAENSTDLASWLGTTFPNMYGASADDHNLLNADHDLTDDFDGDGDPAFDPMTNSQVADFYSDMFRRKAKEIQQLGLGGPVKMDAQAMAVAFAIYVTNETLAGPTAAAYGFLVAEHGVGASTFDVGDAGEAFDVADHTNVAVLDLLLATNNHSNNGVLYDEDGDGDANDEWETLLRTLANDVYSAINEAGDI